MSQKITIIVFTFLLVSLIGVFIHLSSSLIDEKSYAADNEIEDTTDELDQNIGNVKSGKNELPTTGERLAAVKGEAPVTEFVLKIPSINLSKEVVRNVNPSDKEEYLSVLNFAIAHGKYTLLPNEATKSGNIYLFAHRQGAYKGQDVGFFKRVNELESGQEAYIDFDGKTYIYKFRSSKVVNPKDTFVYTAYSPTPTLTLQTCEDGYSKRLILIFDLVGWH